MGTFTEFDRQCIPQESGLCHIPCSRQGAAAYLPFWAPLVLGNPCTVRTRSPGAANWWGVWKWEEGPWGWLPLLLPFPKAGAQCHAPQPVRLFMFRAMQRPLRGSLNSPMLKVNEINNP